MHPYVYVYNLIYVLDAVYVSMFMLFSNAEKNLFFIIFIIALLKLEIWQAFVVCLIHCF